MSHFIDKSIYAVQIHQKIGKILRHKKVTIDKERDKLREKMSKKSNSQQSCLIVIYKSRKTGKQDRMMLEVELDQRF